MPFTTFDRELIPLISTICPPATSLALRHPSCLISKIMVSFANWYSELGLKSGARKSKHPGCKRKSISFFMASAHNVLPFSVSSSMACFTLQGIITPYFTCTSRLIRPGFFCLPARFLFVVFKTLVHQIKSRLPSGDESVGIIGPSLMSSSPTMSPPDNRIIRRKVCLHCCI